LGIQGIAVIDVLLFASPVSKLAFFILSIAAILTAILAWIRYARGGNRIGLLLIGAGSIGVGLLAALYNVSIIRIASESTGITDIRILAPSILEVLLLLGACVLIAVITLWRELTPKQTSATRTERAGS